jgi:hypothetical protein
MSPSPHLHVSGIPQTENGTNGTMLQTEMANFRLLAANGNKKQKFVFLGW